MSIPILGDIIKEVGATIREVIPDPDKRRELEIKLAELDQASQLAQIEVNKVEAGSANLFVAGWRPFIGWVCGAALAYTWIVAPLLQWGISLSGRAVALPALDPDSIFPVVTAMLGLGVMRSFEKSKGVATSVRGRVLTPQLPQQLPTEQETEAPKAKKKGRWLT